jgi:four helix bundle protein
MPNAEDENPNNRPTKKPKPYDLCERCAQFGEAVIAFGKTIPVNVITSPLITQLIKAATSVGANFEEADDGESIRDFHHKVGICRKESRETKFFLRMIAAAVPALRDQAAELYQEAKELNLIFGSMRRTQPRKNDR